MDLGARLLSGWLLVWLAIFLFQTLGPDAHDFYRGLRGRGHAWREAFQNHARLRRFIDWASPPALRTAPGVLLLAYGGDPEAVRLGRLEDAGQFMAVATYLLYPARVFAHPRGAPGSISAVALYEASAGICRQLPFCAPAGERGCLCSVRSGDDFPYRLEYRYEAPNLWFVLEGSEPDLPAPAFFVLALIFSPCDLPIRESSQVNLLLSASRESAATASAGSVASLHADAPGSALRAPVPLLPQDMDRVAAASHPTRAGDMHHCLQLPIAGLPHLRTYRLQLFVVDVTGALFASDERRVLLDGGSTAP
jgi:hypothetical protein